MFGFKKKFRFDPLVRRDLISKLVLFFQSQQVVAGKSIESNSGRINSKALGYMFGFIDGALTTVGQDVTDVLVGMPFMYEVLHSVFPGIEDRCLQFLKDSVGKDAALDSAALVGNQDYMNFIDAIKKGENPNAPFGFGIALIEGGYDKLSQRMPGK